MFVAKYLCTNKICKNDSSYNEDTDGGYYHKTDGTKRNCASTCLNDDECGVFEWDSEEKGVFQTADDAFPNHETPEGEENLFLLLFGRFLKEESRQNRLPQPKRPQALPARIFYAIRLPVNLYNSRLHL